MKTWLAITTIMITVAVATIPMTNTMFNQADQISAIQAPDIAPPIANVPATTDIATNHGDTMVTIDTWKAQQNAAYTSGNNTGGTYGVNITGESNITATANTIGASGNTNTAGGLVALTITVPTSAVSDNTGAVAAIINTSGNTGAMEGITVTIKVPTSATFAANISGTTNANAGAGDLNLLLRT